MLSPVFVYGQDQIFFSEDWTQDGGEAALFYKNSSVTDNLGLWMGRLHSWMFI